MRNLCKEVKWTELKINFMNASIALIKYCLIATQDMIETITYKNNRYNLEGFEEHFVFSSECKHYLAQLEADAEHYKKLLLHLTDKFPKEFKMDTDKEKQVYNNAKRQGISKNTLLKEVFNEYHVISRFYWNNVTYVENLDTGIKDPLKKATVDLWNAANCETEFNYNDQEEGTVFNWGNFTRRFNNPDAISMRLEVLNNNQEEAMGGNLGHMISRLDRSGY